MVELLLTRCLFNFVNHRQGSMSKFSTCIRLSMYIRYLQELLRHKTSNKVARSLSKDKQVLMVLKHFTDLYDYFVTLLRI